MALAVAKDIILRTPPTGLRALTLANVITDATRRAAVEGDGLAVPGGFGVWPAATNLATNGGFETNTTGYIDGSGSNVIARVASGTGGVTAKFGAAMARGTHGAADAGEWWRYPLTLSASTQYTASAWLYIPTAYTGTSVPALNITDFTGATGTLTTDFSLALRDQWQRASVTFTTDVDTSGTLRIIPTVAAVDAGNITYADGIQVELGSIATPYIPTDGGTASRSAGSVTVPVQGLFTAAQGWWWAAITPGYASTTSLTGARRIVSFGDAGGSTEIKMLIVPSSDEIYLTSDTGSAAIQTHTWALNERIGILGAWTAAQNKVSVNGAAFTAAANVPPVITQTSFDFGRRSVLNDSEMAATGILLCGKGVVTQADSASMDTWRAAGTVPTLSQIAQLSAASKPTLLIPAKTADAVLLPAYFGG